MVLKIGYTIENITATLSNIFKIRESAYWEAVENINIIIDIELLLKEAHLTIRQYEIIELYYLQQYTQEEISEQLNISQQAVLDHLNRIKGKIKKILLKWEDEEYDKK